MKPTVILKLLTLPLLISACEQGCKNGGICQYNSCLCPPGLSGSLCQFIEPEVKCLTGHIEIHVQADWAKEFTKINSASDLYMGENNHNRTECQGFQHPKRSDMYVLRVDGLSSCDTSVETTDDTHDYIYRNRVYANHFNRRQSRAMNSPFPMPFIQRLNRLMSVIDWECQYQHKTRDLDDKFHMRSDMVSTVKMENFTVSLDAYKDQAFNAHESVPMPRKEVNPVNDGDLIHFVLHQSEISNRKFSVNNCIMSTHKGNRTVNQNILTYRESVLISDNCDFENSNGIRFSMIDENNENSNVFTFSVMFERSYWLEDSTVEEINPDVYIKCDLSPKVNPQNECDIRTNDFKENGEYYVEAGPFQIKTLSDPYEISIDADSEHSSEETNAYDHLLQLIERFDAWSNEAGIFEEIEAVLSMYEVESTKSLRKLSDFHLLTEEELSEEKILKSNPEFESQYRIMIILGVTVGVILFLVVLVPLVYACTRVTQKSKPSKSPALSAKSDKTKGLDVDHDLFFVEFVDNIHDKVFNKVGQTPIKRTSFDTKSIDISMEYWKKDDNDTLSTKTRSLDFFDPSLTPKNKKASFLDDIWEQKRQTVFKQINNSRKQLEETELKKESGQKVKETVVDQIVGMCLPFSEETSVPYKSPGLIHQHRRLHV